MASPPAFLAAAAGQEFGGWYESRARRPAKANRPRKRLPPYGAAAFSFWRRLLAGQNHKIGLIASLPAHAFVGNDQRSARPNHFGDLALNFGRNLDPVQRLGRRRCGKSDA